MPNISEWARTTPDVAALIGPSEQRSFAELDARATQLARALYSRGLQPGDAVALIGHNCAAFVETVYACQRGGFRLTTVNWHLTAEEAAYIVDDCQAKALVATGECAAVAGPCFASATNCTVGLVSGGTIAGFDSYEDALSVEPIEPVANTAPGTTMLYTSGTTGRPKGVHRPPVPAAPAVNLYGYDEAGGDVHLCTGPLYHAAPLAFSLSAPLAFGATVVLMDKWDAEETLRLIDEHQVTHSHMVPTMFHRLLSLPDDVRGKYDVSSLRYVLHGAAPCPVPVKRKMIEWLGPIVSEYYAATQGAGSFVDSTTWLAHPGTVGRPMVEGQVYVGDDEGEHLAPGEVGLVYLRSPSAARFSYFGDQAKTDSVFRGDYFTLGDVGYMDDEGYLYLTDRSANLIISGGVNIYPAEVDAILLEHPAVGDVAVIGIPDDEWGETVLAVVELRDGIAATPDLAHELIEHCRVHLAHFKCPRRIEFTASLPREDNGKIYKRRLREQYRNASNDAGADR